jgi:hypothetical protein
MKTESPLVECFAKVEWAETEIDKLAGLIAKLFFVPSVTNLPPKPRFPGDHIVFPGMYPTGFHKVASHIDANGIEVWRYVVPDIPTDFNVTVGAILHSLRTPLDQMLSTIAVEAGDTPRQVAFPFGRTCDEFKLALSKQKKLPADARKLIETVKPWKGGNNLLYALHVLNNSDKHHPGLVPINLETLTDIKSLIVRNGMILTLGPRTARHLVMDKDFNMSQPDVSKAPIVKVVGSDVRAILGRERGKSPKNVITRFYNQTGRKHLPDEIAAWVAKTVLPADASNDDMEIATAIPGTKFETEVYPSFNIALGDIDGFEREPVVAVLHQMRQLVERILLSFDKRFFR